MVIEILPRVMDGIKRLYIEIGVICLDIGHAPGDVIVMSNQHSWSSGQRESNHIQPRAAQCDLIPGSGHANCQVRVISQQWLATDCPGAIDNPVVAAKRCTRTSKKRVNCRYSIQ